MEPKGPATVSNDGPGDQSEALNQNRASASTHWNPALSCRRFSVPILRWAHRD
jgi:hypothetical protein